MIRDELSPRPAAHRRRYVDAHCQLGEVLISNEEYDEAVRAYSRAHEIDKQHDKVRCGAVRCGGRAVGTQGTGVSGRGVGTQGTGGSGVDRGAEGQRKDLSDRRTDGQTGGQAAGWM